MTESVRLSVRTTGRGERCERSDQNERGAEQQSSNHELDRELRLLYPSLIGRSFPGHDSYPGLANKMLATPLSLVRWRVFQHRGAVGKHGGGSWVQRGTTGASAHSLVGCLLRVQGVVDRVLYGLLARGGRELRLGKVETNAEPRFAASLVGLSNEIEAARVHVVHVNLVAALRVLGKQHAEGFSALLIQLGGQSEAV